MLSFKSSCLSLVARAHLNAIEAYGFKHSPVVLELLTSTLLHCNILKMSVANIAGLGNRAACHSTTFLIVEIPIYPKVLPLQVFCGVGRERKHLLHDVHDAPIPSPLLFTFLLSPR